MGLIKEITHHKITPGNNELHRLMIRNGRLSSFKSHTYCLSLLCSNIIHCCRTLLTFTNLSPVYMEAHKMDDGRNLFVFSGANRCSVSQHFCVSGDVVNVRDYFLICCPFFFALAAGV